MDDFDDDGATLQMGSMEQCTVPDVGSHATGDTAGAAARAAEQSPAAVPAAAASAAAAAAPAAGGDEAPGPGAQERGLGMSDDPLFELLDDGPGSGGAAGGQGTAATVAAIQVPAAASDAPTAASPVPATTGQSAATAVAPTAAAPGLAATGQSVATVATAPPAVAEAPGVVPAPVVPPVAVRSAFVRAATQAFQPEPDTSEAAYSGGDRAAPVPAALLASTNAATATDVVLGATPVTVGRGEGATVQLTDLRVSGEQFVVRPQAGCGGYELEDRSLNGTLVSKKVVKGSTVQLRDHDLIEVLPASQVGRAAAVGFLFHGPTAGSSAAEGAAAAAAVPPPAKRPRLAEAPAQGAEGTPAAGSGGGVDDLFEGATCIICQEVMHRATSVQPCLHSFCSACLSMWLRRPGPSACPLCRKPVADVARNHSLGGLVDGLLKAHPERRRPAAELAELDSQDALHTAGYDLAKLRAGPAAAVGGPPAGLFGAPALGMPAAAAEEGGSSDEGSGSGDGGSDEEPGPRCFHCGDPAWQTLSAGAGRMAGGPGEGSEVSLRAFSGNDFERTVLEEWLLSRGRGLNAALLEALADPNPAGAPPVRVRLERAALPQGSWADVQACRGCTSSVLQSLAYSLRERIPETELPARARGRPKCWYGRNCRTQNHKPQHAERLDHICEQTRFR